MAQDINMLSTPKISVIMVAYNAEKYIAEAIRSVLVQTEKDFELIIIDDGSVDKTADISLSYIDPRIKFLHNEKNEGITYSRNRAILESFGQYIAILDSDDIALPRRFETESRFLDSHPDFGVIGSAVEVIDAEGRLTGTVWRNILSADMIPGILLFQNYLAHSSTMFRRDALPEKEVYRPLDPAEDYDLWSRIDKKKWKIWNMPEVLVRYRVHTGNINTIYSEKKNAAVEQIMMEALARLKLNPTFEELKIHRTNYEYRGNDVANFLKKRESWLLTVKKQNEVIGFYDKNAFIKVITERWLASCSANSQIGFPVLKVFWKSPLSRHLPIILWPTCARFIMKIFLRK